jgi:hypothetical protein
MIWLEMAKEKTGRKNRFLRRMKIHAKWKHGNSNVEKIRRKEVLSA